MEMIDPLLFDCKNFIYNITVIFYSQHIKMNDSIHPEPVHENRAPVPLLQSASFTTASPRRKRGPIRKLYGLRDLNGAGYGPEKDRSYPTDLETEELEELRTVRTAYGLGRI